MSSMAGSRAVVGVMRAREVVRTKRRWTGACGVVKVEGI